MPSRESSDFLAFCDLKPHEMSYASHIKKKAFEAYLRRFPAGNLKDEELTIPLCQVKHFLGTVNILFDYILRIRGASVGGRDCCVMQWRVVSARGVPSGSAAKLNGLFELRVTEQHFREDVTMD